MPLDEGNATEAKCFGNVCRFCLSSKHCVPVFIESLVNDYLMDAIDLLLLKVDENDGLPNAVCKCCYRIMVDYAKFEARAAESYRILADALTNTEPTDGIKEAAVEPEVAPTLCSIAVETLQTSDIGVKSDTEEGEEAQEALSRSDYPDEEQMDEKLSEPVEELTESATARDKHTVLGNRSAKEKVASSKKKCPVCGKLVSQLSKHMPAHSGTKKFRCEYCEKSFTYDTSLRKHLNIHRGIRNHRCGYCDQSFCDRTSLRYHEAKHREERKFSCGECSDTFFTTSQLKQHSYIAHRERAFRCDLCGSMFPLKHHLEDHMIKHTDERPYGCTMCEKVFKRRKQLLIHMLKHEVNEDK
uniref:Uncharacterized protein n=1 Tax=Anopheles atroparvus TaxID=41427 RepID=A0A182IKT5_ANOAO